MKNRLLLFIATVWIASLSFCGVLFAGDQGLAGTEPGGEITVEADAEPPPQWSSSLDGIKASTSTLLETNNKLNAEHKELGRELEALTAQLLKQQQVVKGLEDTVNQKSEELSSPAKPEDLKAALAKKDKQVAASRSNLAALKARQQNLDRRIALRRLKLKELELDKKAARLEPGSRMTTTLESLDAEIQILKKQVEEQEQQEQALRSQIDALAKKDDPVTVRQRQLYDENHALKVELAKLENETKELEMLAKGELPPGTDPNVQANVQRYQEWQARQRKIEDDVARMKARKGQLDTRLLAAGETDRGLEDKIKVLQDQNRLYEAEVENLRENIAILEYKLNSLERYRDRNKVN
jgi:chromosome segregation ATPase